MNFTKFDELPICGELLFGIQDMGFETPTAVQANVIPIILDKKDVLATAPTGTGKTCAFGIPMIEKIDKLLEKTQALVVCPTRELAMQITEELKRLTKHLPEIRIISVYGGENISKQCAHLRRKPQIVVGTPGRIMDHLRRKTLKLDMLTTLVLDEADEMLNMGFREDIDIIAKACPKYRQTVLFSATMPAEIKLISQSYQTEPESVVIERKNEDMPKIKQIGIKATRDNKDDKLVEILQEADFNLAVIFSNTKRRVDKLKGILKAADFKCDGLHSDIRQNIRTKIMKKFRANEIQILIATDVAARGIDVGDVDLIINYDLPMDEEYYIHRIGRTGRARKEGVAYSLYFKDEVIRMNKYAKATQGHIYLDAEDVIENIDEYSVKTGRIMQPKKKSGGRGRGGSRRNNGEMRGKEEDGQAFAERKEAKESRRENKNPSRDNSQREPKRENFKENKEDFKGGRKDDFKSGRKPQGDFKRDRKPEGDFKRDRKPEGDFKSGRKQQGDFKRDDNFNGKRDNFKSGRKEGDFKSGRKPEGDFRRDRKPEGDFKRERREGDFKRDRKPREDFSEARRPRRERPENIDSFGERAPRKRTDDKLKKDVSFKPKQGKTRGDKNTSFSGKKSSRKY
ncbi:MAG: DEAD/DEAH box helicase [Bacillota bacterium]